MSLIIQQQLQDAQSKALTALLPHTENVNPNIKFMAISTLSMARLYYSPADLETPHGFYQRKLQGVISWLRNVHKYEDMNARIDAEKIKRGIQ